MKKVLLILMLFLVTSCGLLKGLRTIEIQHDTLKVHENVNTYLHDSIYVWRDHNVYIKGDTVYNNTVEYKDRWRIKEVHDTLDREKIVYKEKEVEVPVERPLTRTQKALISMGKAFLLLILAGLGYFMVKKFVFKA